MKENNVEKTTYLFFPERIIINFRIIQIQQTNYPGNGINKHQHLRKQFLHSI